MDYRDPEKSKITVKTTTPTELQNLLDTKPDLSLLDAQIQEPSGPVDQNHERLTLPWG